MKTLIIGLILVLASRAGADVIEWRDSDGVRHYTNLKEEIPAEQRDAAQVVIDEAVRHGHSDAGPAADPAPAEAPRQAQVVYDRAAAADAYVEGLQRGLEMAETARSRDSGNVQINGPLAVANAPAPAVIAPFPYGYPLVTTSFDRGRSRHLTLRMLLEDQFAFDRTDPFLFEPAPFLGPRLSPFLPRGIPFRPPFQARVRTR